MKKVLSLAVLCAALSGCGPLIGNSLPVIIPTGNPITDVLVSAAIQEGARYVAARAVPALMDGLPVRRSRPRAGEVYNPNVGLIFVD